MTYEEYAELDAANFSLLKHLAVSAKLLRYRVDHPRQDTKPFALGRAIHCAVLEPERFESDYVVEPDFGNLRSNAAKAKRAQWLAEQADAEVVAKPHFDRRTSKGKLQAINWERALPKGARVIQGNESAASVVSGELEIVSAEDYALAERCAAEVRAHEVANRWLKGGRAEEVVTWIDEETGMPCKGRLDFVQPTRVLDLKSTRLATLRQIESEFARYMYHVQLAFYHDGAIAAGVIPRIGSELPGIVVVQTVEPYDVAPVAYDASDIDIGRRTYRELLRRYALHRDAGWWPGIAPGPTEIQLPGWATYVDEETQGVEL